MAYTSDALGWLAISAKSVTRLRSIYVPQLLDFLDQHQPIQRLEPLALARLFE